MLPTAHCLVSTHAQAEAILQRLRDAGIPEDELSYVHYSSSNESSQSASKEVETNTDAPSEKAAGGTTAGAVGGAAAGVGTMSIVGLTPLLIVGPAIVAAGAAIGAAIGTAAGLSALDDYGVPEGEHKDYERTLRDGGALVAVHTEDEAKLERAQAVMEQAGAHVRIIRLTKKLT